MLMTDDVETKYCKRSKIEYSKLTEVIEDSDTDESIVSEAQELGQTINKKFIDHKEETKPQVIINKKGGKQKKGSFLAKMSDICSENFFEVDLMKPPVELRTKIVYPNKEMKQNKFDDLIQKQPTLQEKDEMIEEN